MILMILIDLSIVFVLILRYILFVLILRFFKICDFFALNSLVILVRWYRNNSTRAIKKGPSPSAVLIQEDNESESENDSY